MINFIFFSLLMHVSHTLAVPCVLYGKSCTFSGVRTSESDMYFHPSAASNNAVEKVEFNDSVIPILTNELCKAFPNLKELWMIDVSMKQILPKAFEQCKKLKVVGIIKNKLTELEPDMFKSNPLLEEFYFKSNLLKQIDGKMFQHVTSLTHLSISDNLLTEFPIHNFPKLPHLQVLYLYLNDLSDLDDAEFVRKFPNLTEVYLHNNLFDCDRLKVIVRTLNETGVAMKDWEKEKYTRNANLPKVENIECVQTLTNGVLTKKVSDMEEKIENLENKISEWIIMNIILGVFLGIVILIPPIWYVWHVIKKKNDANKESAEYYYDEPENYTKKQ